MVAGIDSAAAVHACANRPILLEVGVVAFDGGRVDALFLPDLIGGAVRFEGTEVVGGRVVGGVVAAH